MRKIVFGCAAGFCLIGLAACDAEEVVTEAEVDAIEAEEVVKEAEVDVTEAVEVATEYELGYVMPPAPLLAPAGLTMGADGSLYAASALGRNIYSIDVDAKKAEVLVEPPSGSSDDLAFGPDGSLAWTAIDTGAIRVRRPDGTIEDVAQGLMFINSIGFSPDGRLFAAQVMPGAGNLYEIDPTGEKKPEVFMKGLLGLNGFEIGSDNKLYGPLAWAHSVVSIDLETKEVETLAEGFDHPDAVVIGDDNDLFVSDWHSGKVSRVDLATGEVSVVTQVEAPIDNLTFTNDQRLFVSQPCEGGVAEVDVNSGVATQVLGSGLGLAGGLSLWEDQGKTNILLTNMVCEMVVDAKSGETKRLPQMLKSIWPTMGASNGDRIALSSFFTNAVQWSNVDGSGEPVVRFDVEMPYGVALLSDQSALVAEFISGNIMRVTDDVSVPPEPVVQRLSSPLGLVMIDDVSGYVIETGLGRLTEFSIETGKTKAIAHNLGRPEGLALLPDGRLAVADVEGRRLLAISAEDGAVTVLAEDLPIGVPSPFGPFHPYMPTDVAASSDGTIYVSSDLEHTVLKLTPQ